MVDLSVVIATYNRVGPLRRCLESLDAQTLPADAFEVIVVVDGSSDGTVELLNRLTPAYPLLVLSQPNQGQPAAANRGIAAAGGRYCLFLDDDIDAGPDLLATHLAAQRDQPAIMGVGAMPIVVGEAADWFAIRYAENWNSHYARLDAGRVLSWRDAYGGNLSAPRQDLLDAGGFSTNLRAAYDIELAYRLAVRGLTPVYLRDAVGHQHECKTGVQLAAALQREGEAAVELCRRHPKMRSEVLGGFGAPSARAIRLRRVLLGLDVPPRALTTLGPLLVVPDRQARWGRFVATYSYWRGVRHAADRRLWAEVSAPAMG